MLKTFFALHRRQLYVINKVCNMNVLDEVFICNTYFEGKKKITEHVRDRIKKREG